MFLQDPHLASYSATVLVRLRLGLSPPLWHKKDMSKLVDGKKRRRIGIHVKCSINFNGSYRCAELQRKPFCHNQVKTEPCNLPLPLLLLTARWTLSWLQQCRAMQNSPSSLQVSQPY